MERQTLLYQPSKAVATTPYANVNAPAGAFGDANGALADAGRGISNLGSGIGQLAQARAASANRRDQDAKRTGLEYRQLAIQQTEEAYQNSVNGQNPDDPAFKAYTQGASSIYLLAEQEKRFQQIVTDKKWTPPSDKEQADDYDTQTKIYLSKIAEGYARSDHERLTILRTEAGNASTDTLAAQLDGRSPEEILSGFDKIVETRLSESGTDKARVVAHLREKLEATLNKNPLGIEKDPARLKALHDKLIDAGMGGAFARNYIEQAQPEKVKWTDFFAAQQGNAANRDAAWNFEEVVKQADALGFSGTDHRAELVKLHVQRELTLGRLAPKRMNRDSITTILDIGQDADKANAFFKGISGDLSAFLSFEDKNVLLSLAQRQARDALAAVKADPSGFAEQRNELAGKISVQIPDLIKNQSALAAGLREYRAAVKATIVEGGFKDDVDMGQSFVPKSLVSYMSSSASDGELDIVYQTLGGGVFRDVARAMTPGPRHLSALLYSSARLDGKLPPAVAKHLNTAQSVSGNAARIQDFETSFKLADKSGKDVSIAQAKSSAFLSITADTANDTYAGVLRGEFPNVETGITPALLSAGLANYNEAKGADRTKISQSIDSTALAIAANFRDNGYPSDVALAMGYKEVLGLFTGSGLITTSHRSGGIPLTVPFPVEHVRSGFEGFPFFPTADGPTQADYTSADQALSYALDSLDFGIKRLVRAKEEPKKSSFLEATDSFFSNRVWGMPGITDIPKRVELSELNVIFEGLGFEKASGWEASELRRLGAAGARFEMIDGALSYTVPSSVFSPLAGSTTIGERRVVNLNGKPITVPLVKLAGLADFLSRIDEVESVSDENLGHGGRFLKSSILRMAPYYLPPAPQK